MNSLSFKRYWCWSLIGVVIASAYPFWMGIRVVADMLTDGMVYQEHYPKYIIPYTPICVAILVGVLLMPMLLKRLQNKALIGAGAAAIAVFFAAELLLERQVIVTGEETVATLEDWQMFMCYVPVETIYKTQTAVEILMGDYHPGFKLHFYMIAVVLILAILNTLYGFGYMANSGNRTRVSSLVLQAVCGGLFLGLCILACFTAFWRDGSLEVSPLSAFLMTLFFLLFGVTSGLFGGSFLAGRGKPYGIWVSAVLASAMTLLMYIGEMCLMNGHLYLLGSGILFESIPGIIFSPFDLLTVLASGFITAGIFRTVEKNTVVD